MESWLDKYEFRKAPTLRYGDISATIDVPDSVECKDACEESAREARAAFAREAVRYFSDRGLEIIATVQPLRAQITLQAYCEPSLRFRFRDILRVWAEETGCYVRHSEAIDQYEPCDDLNGYIDAAARQERYSEALARAAGRLGFHSLACSGDSWAQAQGGDLLGCARLGEAFTELTATGHLSRFPRHPLQAASQGTVAPYGLPAVIVRLRNTCRETARRFGLYLLEATPTIRLLRQVEPGILLSENTPPVDGLWDEARYWAAWRSVSAEAWDLVESWAAVRVLRYVETRTLTRKFYAHDYLPHQQAAGEGDLDAPLTLRFLAERPELSAWRERRACEIAVALDLAGSRDRDLRRHVYGCLATPFPFVKEGHDEWVAEAEDWLANAAWALHEGLISEEWRETHPGEKPDCHLARAGEAERSLSGGLEALGSTQEAAVAA